MKLNTAKHKLKTILKDNMNRRSVLSKKWTIRWTRLHAFSTSDRLFSKRLENSWRRYNLEILFDASGSMAHWHWTWRESAFYKWIQIVQNLVKLFDWVIDINLTFYNLREWQLTTKQILKFDLDKVSSIDDCFKYQWMNDIRLKWWRFVENKDSHNNLSSCQWNWEICNLRNWFERLDKKQWDKIMIIVWDWTMHIDHFDDNDMINNNYYICWQSVKKYNPKTAKEVCQHIEKNWVSLLWVWIWKDADFNYITNNTKINKNSVDDIYGIVFDFLKKVIK